MSLYVSQKPVMLAPPFTKGFPSSDSEIALDRIFTELVSVLRNPKGSKAYNVSEIDKILNFAAIRPPEKSYFQPTAHKYVFEQENGSLAVQFDVIEKNIVPFIPSSCNGIDHVKTKLIVPPTKDSSSMEIEKNETVYEFICQDVTFRIYVIAPDASEYLTSVVVFFEFE